MMISTWKPLAAGLCVLLAVGGVVAALPNRTPEPPPPPTPVAAPAPEPEPSAAARSLQKAALDVDDLVRAAGVHLWKYTLDAPAGTRFRVVFRELTAADAPPRIVGSQSFRKKVEGPVTLVLQICRPDGSFTGVLLGTEEQAGLRISCNGCDPAGSGLALLLPFRDRMKTGGMLLAGDNALTAVPGETVVMTNSPAQLVRGPSLPYPCAQLVIIFDE